MRWVLCGAGLVLIGAWTTLSNSGLAYAHAEPTPYLVFGARVTGVMYRWVHGIAITMLFVSGAAAVSALASVARDWSIHLDRVDVGRCRACGYDLRASPERCPECGRPRLTM